VRVRSGFRSCVRVAATLGMAATLVACASREPGVVTTTAAATPNALPATISKPDGPGPWADSIREVSAFFARHLGVVPSRAQENR
jgi:hypothetical protein